ncbi:hypothetical protein GmHk_12G034623 [Glycine max]|nr:hypothetical protein GmHk_12G034623 [Glycine max]
MSRSRASSSRWTSVNEELGQLLANVPELTIEEHEEWRELANMMQNVAAPPEAFFQTFHATDQIFDEVGKDVLDGVWHLVDKDGNYHNVVYNKDLDQPVIVAGWTALRDFYQLTGDHLVSLHHYGRSKQHTKDGLICTWRTLLNVGLCSIIGGRHLKFELDGNISAKPCP